MKNKFNIKKLVLPNLPYILLGLFATNFGEAWRMAEGTNASEKLLSLFSVLPVALKSFWPSLHPFDLLIGILFGAGLRLAVYIKGKNAKNTVTELSTVQLGGGLMRILLRTLTLYSKTMLSLQKPRA